MRSTSGSVKRAPSDKPPASPLESPVMGLSCFGTGQGPAGSSDRASGQPRGDKPGGGLARSSNAPEDFSSRAFGLPGRNGRAVAYQALLPSPYDCCLLDPYHAGSG